MGKTKKVTLVNVKKTEKNKVIWKIGSKKIMSISVSKKNKNVVKIKGKKAGKTTLTAKVSGKSYKCKVIVKNKAKSVKKNNNKKDNNSSNIKATPIIIYVQITPEPAQTETAKASPSQTSEVKTPEASPSQTSEVKIPEASPSQTSEVKTPEASPAQTGLETVMPEVEPDHTDKATEQPKIGNINFQSDVTYEMTKASYWADLYKDSDKVLLDMKGINSVNEKCINNKECNMFDLLNRPEKFNATERKNALANSIKDELRIPGHEDKYYVDGKLIADTESFAIEVKQNILDAHTEEKENVKYALCTKRTEIKTGPVSGFVGFSANDTDEEITNSCLSVNEPFIVEATTADGKYCWGRTVNCTGWVLASDIAFCADKDEWEQMWNVSGDDFIVVNTSKIVLAPSAYDKSVSEVTIHLGTVLPLVPKDKIPNAIDARNGWYNYIVYLPVKAKDGSMEKRMALVRMTDDVHVGYIPFTMRNVLDTAFKCLGDRYGWGGMMGLMDCSLYTRTVYKCFGFELPRNTTWQNAIPSVNVKLKDMDKDEKAKAISKLEPGSLLFFPGHITIYLGTVNGKQYVISDLGSCVETETADKTNTKQQVFTVAVNSLDLRRGNGNTWLVSMESGIRPWTA